MMTEREARSIAERAFRRGYSQAAYRASQAQAQVQGKDLRKWAEDCLEWRSAYDTKHPTNWAAAGCFPPSPDMEERP